MELNDRLKRDHQNAKLVAKAAKDKLEGINPSVPRTGLYGPTKQDIGRINQRRKSHSSLNCIAKSAFQVMVEADTWLRCQSGNGSTRKRQLWYANSGSSSNEVFECGDGKIYVLAWTHPGLQRALSLDVEEYANISDPNYNLLGVETIAKAKFDAVLPDISGIYQPGGPVRPIEAPRPTSGLKAVKLEMTRDQVDAFISRMSGLMIVTGAPGSGKSTVAFQRIRFLCDQQGERQFGASQVRYTPDRTRVFLANPKLAEQAKFLLTEQLDIQEDVVLSVSDFVQDYLDEVWIYKHDALQRRRTLRPLQQAARTAVLGLADDRDLGRLWMVYEAQISYRLSTASESTWATMGVRTSSKLNKLAATIAAVGMQTRSQYDPLRSEISMDAVFDRVKDVYLDARSAISDVVRRKFDDEFLKWLYEVYDPLLALKEFVNSRRSEAAERIRRGTGARVEEEDILDQMDDEWRRRRYGPEDAPWLAWLLRFALSEKINPLERFRETPVPVSRHSTDEPRWTHVVIDEAQDLSVAEASLIGSQVDPDGALTVAADFRQIVSPVLGMRTPAALHIGRSVKGRGRDLSYPFAKNMRQSRQIGQFLKGFYEAAFRERPTFDVNDRLDAQLPQLIIASPGEQPRRIKQLNAVYQQVGGLNSIAVIQINEDLTSLVKLRKDLEDLDVNLAPMWDSQGEGLLTTSVERIKGLEFDACIVLGLEHVESAALNFSLNRAYVGLSRPTRRLVIIAEEFPPLLRRMPQSLFNITQV